MLGTIALTIAKALLGFVVEQHLENMQSERIEGAPGWYYQQVEGQICDSGFATGALDSIERAKANAEQLMQSRIQSAMEHVAYQRFRDRSDPMERQLVKAFAQDENLPVFLRGSTHYENIEYHVMETKAYVRLCLPTTSFAAYQQERVGKLVKSISLNKRDRAFDSLDAELEATQAADQTGRAGAQ